MAMDILEPKLEAGFISVTEELMGFTSLYSFELVFN
jgi:hypothetical protein